MKKLKPKIKPHTSILDMVKSATCIKDLLETGALDLQIDGTDIESETDYDRVVSELEFSETDAIEVRVDYRNVNADVTTTCSIQEQPACCANVMAFNFTDYGAIGLPKKICQTALLKVCELISKDNDYSFLWFSHIKSNPLVKVAQEVAFDLTREYINKRTKNKLVDLHLAV